MASALSRSVAPRIPSFFSAKQAVLNSSSILLPDQQKVVCRWWPGQDATPIIDPSRYLIDGKGKITEADVDPNSTLASEMRAKYADTGLCHLRNTGVKNLRLQRDLARILIGTESEYEGGANARGRDVDLGNVYDIGAPLSAALHYHHEMTYKQHSVTKLGFLCRHAVNRGSEGWSYVTDSVQAKAKKKRWDEFL